MIHALLAQKELEVTRSELWTVVGDDSRIYTGFSVNWNSEVRELMTMRLA